MSEKLSKEQIDTLTNKILGQWYRQLYIKLNAELAAKNLKLEGTLQQSLNGYIQSAAGDVAAELRLYFEDYGRIQDLKYRYNGKMPPLKAMMDYIDKVGLDKFKYVPGYPVGIFPIGQSKSKYGNGERISKLRIAWGLSKSRVAESKTRGNRKWYAKTVWGNINALINELLGKVGEMTTEEVINSLKTR